MITREISSANLIPTYFFKIINTLKKDGIKRVSTLLCLSFLLLLTGCQKNSTIVNQLTERDANEIIVFLASHNIEATKSPAAVEAGAGTPTNLWNISVPQDQMTDAMSLLNQNGLPRTKGTTLLDLFGAAGMMTSDKEETIRYQAGVTEELKNMIRKIDGIIEVDIQIAFPSAEALSTPGAAPPSASAAVYVKHRGVFDDPNQHLEMKIKRLVSSAVPNLSYDNVTVVPDRARLLEPIAMSANEILSNKPEPKYVKIWSVMMSQESAARFRAIFFFFIFLLLLFGGIIAFLVYKFYPNISLNRTPPQEKESGSNTPTS